MQPNPRRAFSPSKATANRQHANLEPVSIEDVFSALADLCDTLQIDASRLALNRRSARKNANSSRRNILSAEIGQLLAAWHQDPRYLDISGNPKRLSMRGPASFSELCKRAVPKVAPRTLLRELQRAGAINVEDDSRITVQMRSLNVYRDKKLAMEYTVASLLAYIRTLTHNLKNHTPQSNQLFHRIAWSGDFDSKLLPLLKIKVRRQGQGLLESVDNWMMRKSKEPVSSKKRIQVFVGVYLAVANQARRSSAAPPKIPALS